MGLGFIPIASSRFLTTEAFPTFMTDTVFGSAIGAVIGAFEGGSGFGESVAGGAATGAITGGVQGSLDAYEKKKSIVGKCLEGRGYQVLSD